MGNVYSWASPDYIRDHMTIVQLVAFAQNMSFAQEQAAKPLVFRLIEGIADLLAALFKKPD